MMKSLRRRLRIAFLMIIFLGQIGCRPNLPASIETPNTTIGGFAVDPTVTFQATSFVPSEENTGTQATTTEIRWYVHAVEAPNWIVMTYPEIEWDNNSRLRMDMGGGKFEKYSFFPNTGSEAQKIPLPAPFHNLPDDHLYYSPHGLYVIACDQGYLHLVQVSDETEIGQFKTDNSGCRLLVRWTENDSAVAIVLMINVSEDSSPILIWRSDHDQPESVQIPKGPVPSSEPSWSPDQQRFAIPTSNFTSFNPEDQFSYIIVYTDGRQPTIPHMGIGPTDNILWLTNNILYPVSIHGCEFYSYSIADTGLTLHDAFWVKCRYAQAAQLSPNERWLLIDKTDGSVIDKVNPVEYSYLLYDFKTGNANVIRSSTDTILQFAGWSADSSKFYLFLRPQDPTSDMWRETARGRETTRGLLTLDPETRVVRILNPEIDFAWFSPDKKHFFGISNANGSLSAAFYASDGSTLTTPRPIHLEGLLDHWWTTGSIALGWSNTGGELVYLDAVGDLWLCRMDGTSLLLGQHISLADSNQLVWSPDDNLLFVQGDRQAWVILPPLEPGTLLSLAVIHMDSPEKGMARSISGHILKTSDGGLSWQEEIIPSSENEILWTEMDASFFLNASTGWRVVGNELQKTTDGGVTWTEIKQVSWPHTQLDFVSEQLGWAIVSDGETTVLVKTIDGGKTWQEIKPTVAR